MIFSPSRLASLRSFNFLSIIITASFLLASCDGDSPATPVPSNATPATPTGLNATVNSISAISLSWNSTSSASDYEIYRHTSDDRSSSTKIAKPLSSAGSSYQDTGLTSNTQYYYWLKACNNGLCSDFSNGVRVSTQADIPTPPAIPTGLTATVNSINTISLSWSSASNVSDYEIYRHSSDNSGNSTRIANPLSSAGSRYQDTGLTANTQYYYWLKACNNDLCSDFSNAVSASTQADIPTPAIPTGLSATVNSINTISLAWNSASNASDYEIYRHTSDDSSSSTSIANPLSSAGNSYQDTGLTANIQYYYWLKACNNGLCSGFSNAVSASTQATALNDTGITWGGNYRSGNNADCTSNINAKQDCHQGRDTTHNDNSDGHAGFSFTKISSTGAELAASASSWSCVKDNVTGLMWEVKTNSGSADSDTTDNTHTNIHHKDNLYRWGGVTALGRDHTSKQGIYYDDWNSLVNGSNTESLCGFTNWRVPTTNELSGIVHKGRINPSIDTNYFPNTVADPFWSSSPGARYRNSAWYQDFSRGYDADNSGRSNSDRVRLLRSGQ